MDKEKQKNEVDKKVEDLWAKFKYADKKAILHSYCEGYADGLNKAIEIDKSVR